MDNLDVQDESAYSFERRRSRRGTVATVIDAIVPEAIQKTFTNISIFRRSSLWNTYESAKKRSEELKQNKWIQLIVELSIYLVILLFIYFVLVGVPLWKGTVYWIWYLEAHKFVIEGGVAIFLGIALM